MAKLLLSLVAALILIAAPAPAGAVQCVAYARHTSGIHLAGDAWQWWGNAEGAYQRGRLPKWNAVLVFARQGQMSHGHVAVVSAVVNSRVVLVDHANWAPAGADGRGAVARAVPVEDVSPANDWSQVRVWYEPASQFGNRVYHTLGFVYDRPATARPPHPRPALGGPMLSGPWPVHAPLPTRHPVHQRSQPIADFSRKFIEITQG